MNQRPELHRQPFRLRGFDYSRPGVFFVTLCAYQRRELFGAVSGGDMQMSELGRIVRTMWFRSVQACKGIQSFRTEFVVMPNHFHAIAWLMKNGVPGSLWADWDPPELAEPTDTAQRAPTYLGSFIAMYKEAVMERAREDLALRTVWQRNYHEHIIRTEAELHDLRVHIQNNPARWAEDELYPKDEEIRNE